MSGANTSDAIWTAAIADLPSGGGKIFLPPGLPKITASVDLTTKPITVVGSGRGNAVADGATKIVKTGNFDMFLVGAASWLEDLDLNATGGNGGDGVVQTGGRNGLRRVCIRNQGGVGARVGGKIAGNNANGWRWFDVILAGNTSHGGYIHDISTGGGTPNANIGGVFGLISTSNGGSGLAVEHACCANNFHSVHCGSNARWGIELINGAQGAATWQFFWGPETEGNTLGDGTVGLGCQHNVVLFPAPDLGSLSAATGWIDNNTDASNFIDGKNVQSNRWGMSPYAIFAAAGFAGNLLELWSGANHLVHFRSDGGLEMPGANTNPLNIIAGGSPSGIQFANFAANLLKLDYWGHVISNYVGTPTTSLLGANITSVTFTGNDVRGKIVIVVAAGGLAANTRIARCTWANNWVTPVPIPQITDSTSTAGLAAVVPYTGAETTALFDLFCNQALVPGTYTFRYTAIG